MVTGTDTVECNIKIFRLALFGAVLLSVSCCTANQLRPTVSFVDRSVDERARVAGRRSRTAGETGDAVVRFRASLSHICSALYGSGVERTAKLRLNAGAII